MRHQSRALKTSSLLEFDRIFLAEEDWTSRREKTCQHEVQNGCTTRIGFAVIYIFIFMLLCFHIFRILHFNCIDRTIEYCIRIRSVSAFTKELFETFLFYICTLLIFITLHFLFYLNNKIVNLALEAVYERSTHNRLLSKYCLQ